MRSVYKAISSLLCLAARAQTQDSTSSASSSSPSVRVITVGKAFDAFTPNSIKANVGDTISFQFFPKNHSVVRSEYGHPCIPYEYTGENKVGFFSGFFPLDKVLDNPPSWNVTVNDTAPIFFYCSAPGSCINYAMVGVINPNSSTPLSIQRENSKQAKISLSPGQPFPAEGEDPGGVTAPGATSSSISSSSSSSPSVAAAVSHGGGSMLSGGAIAGIVIAAIFVVGLLGAVFFLLGRQKSIIQYLPRPRSKEHLYQNMPPGHPGSPATAQIGQMGQYYAPWACPDHHYGDQHFVAAPPYKSSPLQTRTQPRGPPLQTASVGHGPAELPSPGGEGGAILQEPTEAHPALRQPSQNHGVARTHSRTASSIISRDIPIGLSRGIGSKSSQILGTSFGGSRRVPQSSGRADGSSDVSAPSPVPSPRPKSREGPPQIRPLSWWGRKKSQKSTDEREAPESPTLGIFPNSFRNP